MNFNSNVNEVFRAVLKSLFCFTERFCTNQKHQNHQKNTKHQKHKNNAAFFIFVRFFEFLCFLCTWKIRKLEKREKYHNVKVLNTNISTTMLMY